MSHNRPPKRGRQDDLFFTRTGDELYGSYIRVALKSGKPIKSKGWPWVQACVRGILGGQEKVEKASLLGDGCLLLKTKTQKQTEKLLKATFFGDEECEVVRDSRLNQSRGTIHAYDMIDLSESEVVGWLKEFGVNSAKRFTRKKDGVTENTPMILLTFDRPTCPDKLTLDCVNVTYHVHPYVPNPLMCFGCGRYGHTEVRCTREKVCLRCGQSKHDGECAAKCVNCGKQGHSCLARECEVWMKEKEICRIKTEQDISYPQARKQYETYHDQPTPAGARTFATAVRTPSVMGKQEEELREKVNKLETQMTEMITMMKEMLLKQNMQGGVVNVGMEERRENEKESDRLSEPSNTSVGRQEKETDELSEVHEGEDEMDTGVLGNMRKSAKKVTQQERGRGGTSRGPHQPLTKGGGKPGQWKTAKRQMTNVTNMTVLMISALLQLSLDLVGRWRET